MTFNVHGWRDTHHNPSLVGIIEAVAKISPDILILNEVLHPFFPESLGNEYWQCVKRGEGATYNLARESAGSEKSALCRLAERTGLVHRTFAAAISKGYFGSGVEFGNAILSRFPIVESSEAFFVPPERFQASRRIEAERRSCSMARIRLDWNQDIVVAATHIDQLDEALRLTQVRYFMDQFNKFSPNVDNRMLVGDLNVFHRADYSSSAWGTLCDEWASRGWPQPAKKCPSIDCILESGFADTFYEAESTQGDFPLATCWTEKPLMRLDYIFANESALRKSNIRIDSYRCFTQCNASDHFPVYADMRIQQSTVRISSPRSVSYDNPNESDSDSASSASS